MSRLVSRLGNQHAGKAREAEKLQTWARVVVRVIVRTDTLTYSTVYENHQYACLWLLQVLPWDMVDNSTSPLQTHFVMVFCY
jgi:hypothetical protein